MRDRSPQIPSPEEICKIRLRTGDGAAAGELHHGGAINVTSSGTKSHLWCESGNTMIAGTGEIVVSGAAASSTALPARSGGGSVADDPAKRDNSGPI